MRYLGLSVKGIRWRGEKLSGMQGPPGFVGNLWLGPIIPFIMGIRTNMGFPAGRKKQPLMSQNEILRVDTGGQLVWTALLPLRCWSGTYLRWGEVHWGLAWRGGAHGPGGEASVVLVGCWWG